jgi:hypothetical protein
MGAVEHLKTLCCLGLPPGSAMLALTPLLHEIIPHGWTRMALLEPDATIGNGYSENPATGAIFRQRFWRFTNDRSSPMSLWTPCFQSVGIGWTLHMQGRGWVDSSWYREIEAPLDSCWILDAMIGNAGRTSNIVSLTRPRSARPFTADDVQRLDRLRPWLEHALHPQTSGDLGPGDQIAMAVAGVPARSGEMILTADARLVFQTPSLELLLTVSCGRVRQLPAAAACPRQAAPAHFEASPADHRRRERNFQRAASRASPDPLWRSHARSQMARAGGHTSGRCRQGPEILSHIGDDRTAREPHCPCGARAARKRRDAGSDESRNSPRSWQDETCDRGRTRRPTLLGRGSHENALSDTRCSQFRRASHKNLAGPKTRRGAPKLAARRIDRSPNFLFISIACHVIRWGLRACFNSPPHPEEPTEWASRRMRRAAFGAPSPFETALRASSG